MVGTSWGGGEGESRTHGMSEFEGTFEGAARGEGRFKALRGGRRYGKDRRDP